MHEGERKRNDFYRKTGLMKGRKGAYFDTKSIDFGTFMNKIGPKETKGNEQAWERRNEIECEVL